MAIPTLHLPLEENLEGRDRNGLTAATATGAVRWVDGPRTERKKVTPLLVASPDHTEDRKGPLAPYLSSSVTLGDGKYGKTWKLKKANTPNPILKISPTESRDQVKSRAEVYEETENLLPNPSAEVDLEDIVPNGGGVTLSRVSDTTFGAGRYAVNVTTDGSSLYQGIRYMTKRGLGWTGEARTLVGSLTIRSDWGEMANRFHLRVHYVEGGSTDSPNVYINDVDDFTTPRRLQTRPVITDPTKTVNYVALMLWKSGSVDNPYSMTVDAAQIEERSEASAYVDGDMSEGEWTGTPHNSTSTRVRGEALSGAVRPDEGVYEEVEEGTTNLIGNPSFEQSFAGWGVFSTSLSVTNESSVFGASALKVTTNATTNAAFYFVPAVVGDTLTFSAYVKGPEGYQAKLRLWAFNGGTTIQGTDTNYTFTGEWQRVTVTATMPEGTDRARCDFRVEGSQTNALPVGMSYLADGAQCERKPYATSYCDGDLGPLYSWTGDPHASASVRKPSHTYTPPTESGWFIEEGTTNLIANPSLAQNSRGWGTWSANTTFLGSDPSIPLPFPHPTASAFRVTAGDGGATIQILPHGTIGFDVTTGETYTASVYARHDNPAPRRMTFQIAGYGADGAYLGSGYVSPLTSLEDVPPHTWVRMTNTFTVSGETAFVRLVVSGGSIAAGHSSIATFAQLEQKPYATTYCDGDLGAGYSWTGEPHASPSVRQEARQVISEPFATDKGSIVAYHRVEYFTGGNQYIWALGTHGGANQDFIGLTQRTETQFVLFQRVGTQPQRSTSITAPDTTGQWVMTYVEWDGTDVAVSINNGPFVRTTRESPYGRTDRLNIGSRGLYPLNGSIRSVTLFPRPLTDAERQYLHDNPSMRWSDLNEVDGEVAIGHEATTNLLPNPVLAENSNYWSAYAAGDNQVTGARVDTQPDMGGTCFEYNVVKYNGTSALEAYFYTDNMSSTGVERIFTASALVKATRWVTCRVFLRHQYTDGFVNSSLSSVRIGPAPNRIQWRPVSPDPTRTLVRVSAFLALGGNVVEGDTIWITQGQIEEKPYTTPYTDGDTPTGEWTGTPHASASVREARGDVNFAKTILVRYIEDGESKTATITERSGFVGTAGYISTLDGTLRLQPLDGKTLEVESVLLSESPDKEYIESVATITDAWSFNNTRSVLDVPTKVPFVEEGTTNLIDNPSARYDLRGWVPWRSTLERWEALGDTCFKATRTQEGSDYTFCATDINANQPYSVQLQVRGDVTSVGSIVWIAVEFRNTSGIVETVLSPRTTILTEDWQHLKLENITAPAGTVNARVGIATSTGDYKETVDGRPSRVGDAIYWRNVQFEERPIATTFSPDIDEFGNVRQGYTWTGEPFRSQSVRAPVSFSVPNNGIASVERGSAAIRFKRTNRATFNGYLLYLGNWGDNYDSIRIYAPYDHVRLGSKVAGRPETVVQGKALADGEWETIYVEWDGPHMALYYADGSVFRGTRETAFTSLGTHSVKIFNQGQAMNQERGATLLFDRPLTEAERMKLFETEAWEWDTLFPTPERVNRHASRSPIGIIRVNGETTR